MVPPRRCRARAGGPQQGRRIFIFNICRYSLFHSEEIGLMFFVQWYQFCSDFCRNYRVQYSFEVKMVKVWSSRKYFLQMFDLVWFLPAEEVTAVDGVDREFPGCTMHHSLLCFSSNASVWHTGTLSVSQLPLNNKCDLHQERVQMLPHVIPSTPTSLKKKHFFENKNRNQT